MTAVRCQEMATIWVIEAVDRALDKYSSDNIDVVVNENGYLDVLYHSKNNSFIVEANVAEEVFVNKRILAKELDARDVGRCW